MQIHKQLLLFISLGLFLSACSNVTLDNSGKDPLVVSVDGESYDLPAKGSKKVSLSAGKHQLEVKGVSGKVLTDTTIDVREGGIINASGDNYVIWKMLYGLQKDREILLKEEWMEIDSVEYFGEFKVSHAPYLEKSWEYGLDQDFPTSQKLLIFSDFVVESKVFRVRDFKNDYKLMASPE